MARMQSFAHLHKICEAAAKKIQYPLVIEHLHTELDEEFWEIAESTVIYFLPRAILALPTKQERRDALETIPNDGKIKSLRLFVENGIVVLWEQGKKVA